MSRQIARDRFRRIASSRSNRVLHNLELLMNCADRKNYDYDETQVNEIFNTIESAVAQAKSKFNPKVRRRIRL